jgi:NADH-quinone oxidoreductase subunit N
MYFEGETEKRISEPKGVIAVMIFSIIFMVGLGVYPEPIIEFAKIAAPTITLSASP